MNELKAHIHHCSETLNLGYTQLRMMMMVMQQQPASTGNKAGGICLSVCVFLFLSVDRCLLFLLAS
jgi:hypothetical protein